MRSGDQVRYLLRSEDISMLVLDHTSIRKVHLEQIPHPLQMRHDEVRGHACFVKENSVTYL